jgi:hypothetical protein
MNAKTVKCATMSFDRAMGFKEFNDRKKLYGMIIVGFNSISMSAIADRH